MLKKSQVSSIPEAPVQPDHVEPKAADTDTRKLRRSVTVMKTVDCAVVSEGGEVLWKKIMKKFSDAAKDRCRWVTLENPREDRAQKTFLTGSTYDGKWNFLGISGRGNYKFIHGVEYEGDFENGEYNGDGNLKYLDEKITVKARFVDGKIIEDQHRKLIFDDGLLYDEQAENWSYCQPPDRRYFMEYEFGLAPAGESILTAEVPPKEIPPGCYDVGYGIYKPDERTVYSYDDHNNIVRVPSPAEETWIKTNCRHEPLAPVGPIPVFNEKWLQPELDMPIPPPPAAVRFVTDVDSETDSELESTIIRFTSAATVRQSRLSRFSETHSSWKARNLVSFRQH